MRSNRATSPSPPLHRKTATTRDDRMRIWMQINVTSRPNRAGNDDILKPLANFMAELAQRLKGILAPMHGCCPRVILFPVKRDCAIPNAYDVRHNTNCFSCLVQPWDPCSIWHSMKPLKMFGSRNSFARFWHSIARIQECHALCIGQSISLVQWQCACPKLRCLL